MSTRIIRGILQSCDYETAYDSNGNEYKQYGITIAQARYTARLPKDIYLQVGEEVLLELEQGAEMVVSSGYCLKMGNHWGPNWKALRAQAGPAARFEFMEGKVTEKRKSTTGMHDNTRPAGNRTRISYTILMGEQQFKASNDEGEWLKIGMDIALVLKENSPVLILDKQSGKITGLTRPYYILFLLMIAALIAVKIYLVQSGSTVLPNSAVIVLSIFLVAAAVLNILTYIATNRAKQFLDAQTGKRT